MSESKPATRIPSPYVKVRHLAVYQPGVPLRAVLCVLGEDGKTWAEDIPIVGVQAVVSDTYNHPRIPAGAIEPAWPQTSSDRDIRNSNWKRQNHGPLVTHEVVFWSDEFQCPVTVEEITGTKSRLIVGPRDNPGQWWNDRIAEEEDGLRAK